jgi:hypothetical protein
MTLMTAIVLATREDVHIEYLQGQNGKYGICLTLGESHRPLLTGPLELSSQAAAEQQGADLIELAKLLLRHQMPALKLEEESRSE